MKKLLFFALIILSNLSALANNSDYQKKIIDKVKNEEIDSYSSIESITKNIEQNPNEFKFYISRAKLYHEQKEFELSINDYKKALELNPLNKDANTELRNVTRDYGLHLIKLGKKSEGIIKLKECLNIGINNALMEDDIDAFYLVESSRYFEDNEPEKAIIILKKVKKTSPLIIHINNLLLNSYMKLAIKQIKKYELIEAKNNIENAKKLLSTLNLKPDGIIKINHGFNEMFKIIYKGLGNQLNSKKRYKDAIFEMNKLLEIEINSSVAYRIKGYSEFMLGNKSRGINLILRAIKLEPQKPEAYYTLSCIYSLDKKTLLALKYLEKSIKLNPEFKNYAKKDNDFNNIRLNKNFEIIIK